MALRADERRDKLRKAAVRSKYPLTRRCLIKLSGLKPDVDIPIVYTGLRPGEKLYEEKLMEEEGLKRTANNLIHIGSPIPFDTDKFFDDIERLLRACYRNSGEIKQIVAEMVPTYKMDQE